MQSPTRLTPKHDKQALKVERNLKIFDTLDFDVFSNPKWGRLKESHSADIVVTCPNGHATKAIDHHFDDLKAAQTVFTLLH